MKTFLKKVMSFLLAAVLTLGMGALSVSADEAAAAEEDGIVGVFTGDDTIGYRYILGSKQVNLREVIGDINKALSGKGGGSPTMVQGTMNCKKEQIISYFKE